MRTDISKIHDNSKWTELTPGNHVYGGGTSKAFNTVFCAHLSVRIHAFRSYQASVSHLTWSTARAAVYAHTSANSEQSL